METKSTMKCTEGQIFCSTHRISPASGQHSIIS